MLHCGAASRQPTSLPPPPLPWTHLLYSLWLATPTKSQPAIGSRLVEEGLAARCVIKLVGLSQYALEAAESWFDLYGGDGKKCLVAAVVIQRSVLPFVLSPFPLPAPIPGSLSPSLLSPLPSPRRRSWGRWRGCREGEEMTVVGKDDNRGGKSTGLVLLGLGSIWGGVSEGG